MTVGVDIKGHITGVKIGSHNETPGLGQKRQSLSLSASLVKHH